MKKFGGDTSLMTYHLLLSWAPIPRLPTLSSLTQKSNSFLDFSENQRYYECDGRYDNDFPSQRFPPRRLLFHRLFAIVVLVERFHETVYQVNVICAAVALNGMLIKIIIIGLTNGVTFLVYGDNMFCAVVNGIVYGFSDVLPHRIDAVCGNRVVDFEQLAFAGSGASRYQKRN